MSIAWVEERTLSFLLSSKSRLYWDIEYFIFKNDWYLLLPTWPTKNNNMELYYYSKTKDWLYELKIWSKDWANVGMFWVNKETWRVHFVMADRLMEFKTIQVIKEANKWLGIDIRWKWVYFWKNSNISQSDIENLFKDAKSTEIWRDIFKRDSTVPVSKKQYTEIEYWMDYMNKQMITEYPSQIDKQMVVKNYNIAEWLSNLKEMIINWRDPRDAIYQFVDNYLINQAIFNYKIKNTENAFNFIDDILAIKNKRQRALKLADCPWISGGDIYITYNMLNAMWLSFHYVKEAQTLVIWIDDAWVKWKKRYISIPWVDNEADDSFILYIQHNNEERRMLIAAEFLEDNAKIEKTSILNPLLISAEDYDSMFNELYYDANNFKTMLLYKPYFNVSLDSWLTPDEILKKMVNIAKADRLMQRALWDRLQSLSDSVILEQYARLFEIKREIIAPMREEFWIKFKDTEDIYWMARKDENLPESLSFMWYFKNNNKKTVKHRMRQIYGIRTWNKEKIRPSTYSMMALRVQAIRYELFIEKFNKWVFEEWLDINTVDWFNEYYKRIITEYKYINEEIPISEMRKVRILATTNRAIKARAKKLSLMSRDEVINAVKWYSKIIPASIVINNAINKVKNLLNWSKLKDITLNQKEYSALWTLMKSKLTEEDILRFMENVGTQNRQKMSDILYAWINFVDSPQELFTKLSILQENVLLWWSYEALWKIWKLEAERWRIIKELNEAEKVKTTTTAEVIENRKVSEQIKSEPRKWWRKPKVQETSEITNKTNKEEDWTNKKSFSNYYAWSKDVKIQNDINKWSNDSVYSFVNNAYNIINWRVAWWWKKIIFDKEYIADVIIKYPANFIKTDMWQQLILNVMQNWDELPETIVVSMLDYLYGIKHDTFQLTTDNIKSLYNIDANKLINDYVEVSKRTSWSKIIEYSKWWFFVKNWQVPKLEHQETTLLWGASRKMYSSWFASNEIPDLYWLKFDSKKSASPNVYSSYKNKSLQKWAIINNYNSPLTAQEFDYLYNTKYKNILDADKYLQIPIANKYIWIDNSLQKVKITENDLLETMTWFYNRFSDNVEALSIYYYGARKNIIDWNNPIAVVLSKEQLKNPVSAIDKIFADNPEFNQIIVWWWNSVDNLRAMQKVINDWKYKITWYTKAQEWNNTYFYWISWAQNEYRITRPETLKSKETGKDIDFNKLMDKKYDLDWCNSLSL